MKLFIDTANIEEIKKASELGIICGVTTNPTLIAKQGQAIDSVMKEIVQIVDGPISAEVNALDCEGMIEEAMQLTKIHPNIVIKLPMNEQGLKTCKKLSALNIKTNVTLIFSAAQALLAARAGATFVSPFVGRVDDIANNGVQLIAEIAEMFRIHNIQSEIIAASIRHPQHVVDCALAMADIATVPYQVIEKMMLHPLTDIGIEQFIKDYNNSLEV